MLLKNKSLLYFLNKNSKLLSSRWLMWFLINTGIVWIMWIITKLKFKSEILKTIFFLKNCINFFSCVCMTMSKTLSAIYYQENKEILQKKYCERYQNLSKEEKQKNGNMVVNVIKVSQKMESTSLLSIEKNVIEWEKIPYYRK